MCLTDPATNVSSRIQPVNSSDAALSPHFASRALASPRPASSAQTLKKPQCRGFLMNLGALRLRRWRSRGIFVDWVSWPEWSPAWHHLKSSCSLQTLSLTQSALLRNYRIRLFTVQALSHVQLFVTPQTVAHQAPLSMVFSTQVYWSGLPFPSLGDLPDPGSNPHLLHVSCVAGGFLLPSYQGSPLLFSKRKQFFSHY